MNRRWIALSLMVGMTAGCAANEKKHNDAGADTPQVTSAQWDESEARRLEKFAISQCLMRAFPNSPMLADAGRASGAYVELGTSGPDVYDKIVAVVQAHRARPYNAKSGKSLFVMQCLDLLHDPTLEALIRQPRRH